LFTQTQTKTSQTSVISVKYGNLSVRQIELMVPDNHKVRQVSVKENKSGKKKVKFSQSGNVLTINMAEGCKVTAGSDLIIRIN